ncbi:MAG: hypothetical protein ACKOCM_00195 [Cyanobacteriota bacterium]
MNDHDLGQTLRAHALAGQPPGTPQQISRLQAVIGDLVTDHQRLLLPALRALVASKAFTSALGQNPPLADARVLPRLRQELAATYAPEVLERMENVLAGLLNQPPPAVHRSVAAPPAITPTTSQERGYGVGLLVLTGVLAMLSALAMAIVGGGVALWLRQRGSQSQPPPPATVAAPVAPLPAAIPPDRSTTSPPLSGDDTASTAAQQSLSNLYNALSRKDLVTARTYYNGGSGDQFDPAFFNQFAGVSLSDLKETGRSGPNLFFTGVVTFLYPDGTRQLEHRTFTVDTSSSPAVVTASAFTGVIRLRS